MLRFLTLFEMFAFCAIRSEFGTATLGRQTDWNFDWLGSVSTAQVLGDFPRFAPGNLDGLGSTLPTQLSNTVMWKSADYRGFTIGALYGFPGASHSNMNGRTSSFGADYTSGPLKLVAVYSGYHDRLLPLSAGLGLTSFEGQALASGATFNARQVRDAGVSADPTALTA